MVHIGFLGCNIGKALYSHFSRFLTGKDLGKLKSNWFSSNSPLPEKGEKSWPGDDPIQDFGRTKLQLQVILLYSCTGK